MKIKYFNKSTKILVILLSMLILITIFNTKKVNASIDLNIASPSGILIETSTNKIIYEKNSKEHRAPASMTKIMTMILVMEEIGKGTIKLEDKLIASENASKMGGTTIYLDTGEEMTVEDLLKGVAITSANDAAVCLAERIGGTVENFAQMMNTKAKEIGCNDSNFVNPNGLPEDNHYSCAYDMGIMGSYLVNNYPGILKYTKIYEDYLRKGTDKEFWLVNTNKLVRFYDNVDGLKTGWTNDAGYCLTATMYEKNIRFVAVVMGGESPAKRNSEIITMLNYGISTYELFPICKEGEKIEIITDMKVSPNTYTIIVPKDINILIKKGEQIGNLTRDIEINGLENNHMKLYLNGELLYDVELTIQENVEKASFFTIVWEVIKNIFFAK